MYWITTGLNAVRGATACLLLCITATVIQGEDSEPTPLRFDHDILPILANNCYACHGPDEDQREADLRLDRESDATTDRGGYAVIVPGVAAESELIRRVLTDDPDERMPPPASKKKLTESQVSILRRWIEQGAHWQGHWAFQPVDDPRPPVISPKHAVANPIDRFILARLETNQLLPSTPATRPVLIRRIYVDLIGLLPTPDEVDAFVNDARPDAYERVVDRLLSSPHYGERFGRHWLDQARYADSDGYAIDGARVMWPYRDWVIGALNEDLSFDQFTIDQLGGDLLPNPTTQQRVSTGFHRNTLVNQEGGSDPEQFRNETVVDRVNTTGAVWLGLTVGCAQCHAHKFDPLTQREYYQLFAFFNSTLDQNSHDPRIVPVPDRSRATLSHLNQAIEATRKSIPRDVARPDAEQLRDSLERALKHLRETKGRLEARFGRAMVMQELETPRKTHVHVRGDFLRPGETVQPDVPAVLPPLSARDEVHDRLDLARWLVSSDNPLTARVTVNRAWMRFFGGGLVETENDFGTQGTPPTHPQLLDWLAQRFMQDGWSMKKLHRLIVTSATYCQSSKLRDDLRYVDPSNKLLARQSRIRVDAEIVRDLGLSASGLLCDVLGGPGVYPPQPDGVYAFTQQKKKWPTSQGGDRHRRGMYTFFYRSAPHPSLSTFDAPNFQTVCTRRVTSNTPLQSLAMANDTAVVEMARALAIRVLVEQHRDDRHRLVRMFRLCLGRYPDDFETRRLESFLLQQRDMFQQDPASQKSFVATDLNGKNDTLRVAAWTALARVLLNMDEFVTRD